ncbi:uncharacterized protein SETTUDRAFT_166308 [Exserohilum turcica Et28A]|uniref:Uncharacterized protein n=1 Tax=Exserohilum turcicum (strain 28A) TaxID=671987 RepID=R0JTL3_EXST2|nr:uncharacterized protein SETTUDRAFT_166308 [Exserohilum turcica Et28A]EOA80879.1 hypothetical protein SETTUDRAFT_166308 [Exserohilum turcica Et28A]
MEGGEFRFSDAAQTCSGPSSPCDIDADAGSRPPVKGVSKSPRYKGQSTAKPALSECGTGV